MDLGTAQSVLLSGIVLGSLYALMATGLSLIWTTLGIFNFAHGVFMTLGAFIAWQIGDDLGWGFGPAAGIAVAVAAMIGLGCISEFVLVRPLPAPARRGSRRCDHHVERRHLPGELRLSWYGAGATSSFRR